MANQPRQSDSNQPHVGGNDPSSQQVSLRKMALLKSLLQTPTQQLADAPNPGFVTGNQNQQTSKTSRDPQSNHPQLVVNRASTSTTMHMHQPNQNRHQSGMQPQRKQKQPVCPHSRIPAAAAHSNIANEVNNLRPPQLNPQTFTLRPSSANLNVDFNAKLRINEIEDFGRHILETCQAVDTYIYDAFYLKKNVLPTLEANNGTLKKERDDLAQENERLRMENNNLTEKVEKLQVEITFSQADATTMKAQIDRQKRQMEEMNHTVCTANANFAKVKERLEVKTDEFEKAKLTVKVKDEAIQKLTKHEKRLRYRRMVYKLVSQRRATEVAALKAELKTLKQTMRCHVDEMDSLQTEMGVLKAQRSHLEAGNMRFKEECKELKEYVAKLERSIEQEAQVKVDLEKLCSGFINTTFEKSIKDMIKHMEQRQSIFQERKRKRKHAFIKTVSHTNNNNNMTRRDNCDDEKPEKRKRGEPASNTGTNSKVMEEEDEITVIDEIKKGEQEPKDEMISQNTPAATSENGFFVNASLGNASNNDLIIISTKTLKK